MECCSKFLWLLIVLWSSSLTIYGQDCSELQSSDLGDSTTESPTGLLADTLRVAGGDSTNPAVQILEFNTVCLSQGALKDTYTRTSVVARYTADGTESTSQVEYECSGGLWRVPSTGTPTVEDSPNATLATTVRADCILCLSPETAPDSVLITEVEHCTVCDPCVGLMRCIGQFFAQTCCSYFDMAGSCVTACPANSSPGSDFDCVCDPGYEDNATMSNCMEINECSPDPCENGGICTDLVNAYSCACVPGYTDDNCTTNIDECDPDPCENGGTCTDLVNAYSCACVPGYTDDNCTTNIDECSPDPCENGGTCTDLVNAYSCACVPGYTDDNCTTNFDECSSDPCENGGTCTDLVNAYSCACSDFWGGLSCEECSRENCLECVGTNATCINCISGYIISPNGSCVEDPNFCNPECQQGTCEDRKCSCPDLYTGDGCADLCSVIVPGCLLCSDELCTKCQNGFLQINGVCEVPCTMNACTMCLDDGEICLACATGFTLNRAENKCEVIINQLSDAAIIGIIVGAIVLAIFIIGIISCSMSWAYNLHERPRMKKRPKRTVFQDHGEQKNPIFGEKIDEEAVGFPRLGEGDPKKGLF